MAPKKKEAQKMSLGDFLSDQSYGGSWADEVEDTYSGTQALPPPERRTMTGWGSSDRGDRGDRGYPPRDMGPQRLPDKPPYTAHLGNLSYEATAEGVNDFFADCDIINVRIIEDREQQRPKGFAYAEFATVDGLKQALTLDGTSFQGRTIRIKIADPPRDRDGRGDFNRDLSDWTRKGPLADLPGRDGGERRGSNFGERRPPREPREPLDDGKVRDFGNWERKGPLSPLPEPEKPVDSREGSRPRATDAGRTDSFRTRRESPAWGEGQAPRQETSRPPRREMADRPERPDRPERVPTAAEKDMQWRTSMRPDPPAKSPEQSRDGSEAPPSPAGASPAPGGRPRLQLAKRTVSEATDILSPQSTTDSKASPFGAARPIDTATREREIEEKRLQHIKEKREAEEKVKEERRLAKEAAAKETAEKAAQPEADLEATEDAAASHKTEESTEAVTSTPEASQAESGESAQNGAAADQALPVRQKEPREPREPRQPREYVPRPAAESGNWRQPSGEQRPPRGPPTGPRRGGGPPRGGRHEGPRPPRANGSSAAGQPPPTPTTAEGDSGSVDEDGWTTVPNKNRRNQAPRGVAS